MRPLPGVYGRCRRCGQVAYYTPGIGLALHWPRGWTTRICRGTWSKPDLTVTVRG